jgi:hypothetical protein
MEQRIWELAIDGLAGDVYLYSVFDAMVSMAKKETTGHGARFDAWNAARRPVRYRSGVVRFYLLEVDSGVAAECSRDSSSLLCARLRGSRQTCAPVARTVVVCDASFFSRVMFWAMLDSLEFLHAATPEQQIEFLENAHHTYLLIESMSDPIRRQERRRMFLEGMRDRGARALVPILTGVTSLVVAPELGHIVLGHDLDDMRDVGADEKAADDFAFATLRGSEDLVGASLSSLLLHASFRGSAMGVGSFAIALDEALAKVEAGNVGPQDPAAIQAKFDAAFRRLAGCDVTHGSLARRFRPFLERLLRDRPRSAEGQSLYEGIVGLEKVAADLCGRARGARSAG